MIVAYCLGSAPPSLEPVNAVDSGFVFVYYRLAFSTLQILSHYARCYHHAQGRSINGIGLSNSMTILEVCPTLLKLSSKFTLWTTTAGVSRHRREHRMTSRKHVETNERSLARLLVSTGLFFVWHVPRSKKVGLFFDSLTHSNSRHETLPRDC